MLRVDLLPRQLAAALILGVATFALYTSANGAPVDLAAMAALGAGIHMLNIGLRDATFKALIAEKAVGPKDLIARCCMVVFDAVLLFGIVTAAGLALPWMFFVSLALTLAFALPVVVVFMTRGSRAAQSSQQGLALDYWAPPVFTGLMAVLLGLAQAVVLPSGSQPFVHLVLLSTIFAINRSGSRTVGLGRIGVLVSLGGTLVLLLGNYLLFG